MSNEKLLLGHIVSGAATEMTYIRRPSYMKDAPTEENLIFDLDVGNGFNVPIFEKVGFMQRNQFNQQHQYNDIL